MSFANAFERYDIGEQSYTIAGRTISISAPRDPAVLLDELIANGSEVDVTDERLPYWAEIWSSSIALSEHLLEAGEVEPSTRCLELGCGLGLVGVSLGFRTPHVRFTDYQPDAVAMARHNWRGAHGGEAEGAVLDWREPPPPAAGMIWWSPLTWPTRSVFLRPWPIPFHAAWPPAAT